MDMDQRVDVRRSPVSRFALLLGCGLGLAACQNQLLGLAPATPHVSTWRVVVLGGGDDLDGRARAAIGDELLRRKIATAITNGAGSVTHILDVDITDAGGGAAFAPAAASHGHHRRGTHAAPPAPRPIIANVTVSEGLDARLTPERAFSVGAPATSAASAASTDPVATLAAVIADTLAPAPATAHAGMPPAPATPGRTTAPAPPTHTG